MKISFSLAVLFIIFYCSAKTKAERNSADYCLINENDVKSLGEEDDTVECPDGLEILDGGSLHLGGGDNNVEATSDTYASAGCNILGDFGTGDGNDIVQCEGYSQGIYVHSGASVQLGSGNNEVKGTTEGYVSSGCYIWGDLSTGDGNDVFECEGGAYGIYVSGGTISLGIEADVITATATNGLGAACKVEDGGQILALRGPDELYCTYGGLQITGSNSMVDMGNGNDQVSVEGDIEVSDGGQFLLGKGDDTVTSTGCVQGDVDLGNGNDSIYAEAVHGTIFGGDGDDCFQPGAIGNYVLSCGGDAPAILKQPPGSCDGVDGSPSVTLDSIEQIGCNWNRNVLISQVCSGLDVQISFQPFS